MIARFCLFFGLLLLVSCRSTMLAQEVRKVDGQNYIQHTVLKGQTLFAISKHYAVPIEAISLANPSAGQGLSLGQVLLIPVKAQVKKELKTAPALMESELGHTVAKKETLFGISRKYGVELSDLIARNPSVSQGVKEGMVVVIPVSKITTLPVQQITAAIDDKSISHLVQPNETVYSLSKRYDVSPEEIQATNGGLPQGLKAGTYVRIPAKEEAPKPIEPVVPVRPIGTSNKVVFLLPFAIAANDSVQSRNKEKGLYGPTDAAVQFYAGARMAIDSLEQLGLRADISVLDVGDDALTWTPVLKNDAVLDADLCIGPFHRAAIERLCRTAPSAHIVCPVPQSNKVLLGNPNVSKVLSGRPDQLQQMARYVAFHHAQDNIILCAPDIADEKDLRDQFRITLEHALEGKKGRLRDSVLVAKTGKRDIADVITKLSATQQNVVIATSEDIEYVTALVSRLAELVPGKRIILFGLNSWTDIGTLDLADLEALNTHLPASTWVDRDNPRVKHFIHQYRDRFENEPGDYAFLGFDVSFFYLRALMEYGRDFPSHFAEVNTQPLHLSFKLFKSGEENGYRNENAFMIEYGPKGLRKAP